MVHLVTSACLVAIIALASGGSWCIAGESAPFPMRGVSASEEQSTGLGDPSFATWAGVASTKLAVTATTLSIEGACPGPFRAHVTATASGGFPPYIYQWSGVPGAGPPRPDPNATIDLPFPGPTALRVDVRDTQGNSGSANTTATAPVCTTLPPSNDTTTSTFNWTYLAIIIVLGAVGAFAIIYFGRRRKPPAVEEPRSRRSSRDRGSGKRSRTDDTRRPSDRRRRSNRD